MKEYWKMLKRGLAMLLAVVMVLTSSNLGVVLRAAATGEPGASGESVSLSEIVLDIYGDKLSENLKEIIEMGAVNVTTTYTWTQPTAEDDLINVDEKDKEITALVYSDGVRNWSPVAYRLVDNDGNEVEDGVITEWPNGEAEVTYEYAGNAFTVQVDYEAEVTLDVAQQEKLLSSGEKLAEDIATLLLLKENIIPEKPEGWETTPEEDRVDVFGQEVCDEVAENEKLQKYIDGALASIPGMAGLELNPQIVLMFMTQKVLEFNGEKDKSAIDLLGTLGEGITTVIGHEDGLGDLADVMLDEYPDVFKYDRKTGNIYVELKIKDQFPSTANQTALNSLIAQGDGLLLSKYLSENGSKSYLEWLMVTYDALKAAVEGNYEDLNQLATSGLPGMVSDMMRLQVAVDGVEKAAWDLIADTAAEYGLEITKENGKLEYYTDELEGFDRLLADYAEVKDQETGKSLNDQLAELEQSLQTKVPAGYESYVPALPVTKITSEDDLDALIKYVDGVAVKLDTALNHIYGEIDDALAVYNVGTVRNADDVTAAIKKLEGEITDANKNIGDIQKAVASLVGKPAAEVTYADIEAKIAELKGSVDTSALKPYDDAVANAWASAQNMAKNWGYPDYKQIVRGADLSVFTALESWLNDQPAAAKAAYAKVLADVDAAIAEMLPDGVELEGKFTTIDSAAEFVEFRTWIADYLEDAKQQYADGLAEINNKVAEAEKKIRDNYSDFGVQPYRGGALETTDSLDVIKGKIQDIRYWMNHLKNTINTKKAEALDKAEEYGVDLTGSNAVAEAMEKARAEADEAAAKAIAEIYPTAYDEANKKLAEINKDLSMATFGETTRWTKAADIDAAIENAKNGTAEAAVWAAFNKELPEQYHVTNKVAAENHIKTLDNLRDNGYVTETQYNEIAGPLNSAIQGVDAIGNDYLRALETAKTDLADAVDEINKTKEDELEKLEADLKEKKDLLDKADEALVMIEEYAALVAEDSEKLKTLYDGKALIDEGEAALTKNASDLDKLESKLAEEEAKCEAWQDVSGKLAEVANAKTAIVNAQATYEAKLKELAADQAADISTLEKQKAAWDTQLAKIEKANNGIAAVNGQVDNLDKAATILDMQKQVAGYDLAGAKTAAQDAYASLLELPDYLTLLAETKDELTTNIDMLNILITMLNLLCEKIEPIYANCENNTWNARNILKTTGVDYKALTELVYANNEFQDVSNNVEDIVTEHTLPTATVEYKMSMFDVQVVIKAQVVNDQNELVELNGFDAGMKTLVAGDTGALNAANELFNSNLEAACASFAEQYELFNTDCFTIKLVVKNDKGELIDKVPDALDQNLTIEFVYTPNEVEVTSDIEELAGKYAYGWNLILPEHENAEKEWEYSVKFGGSTKGYRQGETVVLRGLTEISRKVGDKSASELVEDVVIKTVGDLNDIADAILKSDALDLNDSIYIRVPNNNHLVKSTAGNMTTVTALPYNSGAYGDWIPVSATIDGEIVEIKDGGIIETEAAFEKIVVNYALELSSSELGVDLGQYINAPYQLAADYNKQKSVLDNLVAAVTVDTNSDNKAETLEALGMLDRNTEMMGFRLGDVFGMLGGTMEGSIKGIIMDQLGVDDATANQLLVALKAMDNEDILPTSGKTPLYGTLENYTKQGMAHYYKYSDNYIEQIAQLNEVMQLMPVEALSGLGGVGKAFKALYDALGSAEADLQNYPVSKLIKVESDSLNTLLDNLGKYEQAEPYTVPAALTWKVDLTATGDGIELHMVTVNVEGFGSKNSGVITVKPGQGFDHASEATAIYNDMVEESIRKYFKDAVVTTEVTEDGTVNHIYTINRNSYDVVIPGVGTVTLTYLNRVITLVRHETAGFAWMYDVPGEPAPVEVRHSASEDREYPLTLDQLDALIAGAEITRTEVNVGEADLIDTIEKMGGVLFKDADGKYSMVVGIDLNNTESLMNFVLNLYTNGDVQLGGETLVANGQFHLQTLVNAILNSGTSTNELNANIAANGTVKHTLVLPEGLTVVGNKPLVGNHMTLIESTLTMNGLETMPLYLTLTGDASAVKGALNTISGYGVDVQLDNGSANLTITIPEPFYTAYLATLSMVGEVDLRNVNDVNAEIALGYITNMITEIMNTEGVSIDTFGKTIGVDLSAYESYYDMAKDLMNLVKFGEDGCTIILDLPIIPIKGVIDSLEGSIELPIEGVSLGGMIAEYETGLDVAVGAKINNFANDYDVLFVDVKAGGLANKVGMKALDETGKLDLATTSVVILLNDIENLYITDTMTLVDLNGFNVAGTITGGPSADVIVVDSNYVADEGVVGNVSGNVTLLAGKYLNDVSAYVNDGYMQDGRGVVCNKLFTVSETDNVITVTLNTTVADAKTLLTQEGVFGLAAEILFDQFINHYNVAGVSMDGNMIYNINFEDILGIVSGGTDAIVDTALAFVDEAQLSAVFNALVADLTDYANIGAALSDDGNGVIASHNFTTTTWGLDLTHDSENDTLDVNFGGSYGKSETKTLQLEIEGEARGAMATLATALGKVLTVKVELGLEDIYRNDAGQFNVKGEFTGSVVFDFTSGDYGVMMALIMANGADEALKADLVEAVETYYATTDPAMLREVYNALTIEDICSSLANGHNSTTTISEIVENLGLTCADKVLANVDESEMGFDLLIDALAYGLRLLDSYGFGETVTDSGFKLGRLETSDDKGYYYGRSGSKGISGSNTYLDYALNAETIELKVYLFGEHVCVFDQKVVAPEYLMAEATYDEAAKYYYSCICGKSSEGITNEWFHHGDSLVKAPTIEIEAENIKIGGKLHGVKYDEAKGYLILDTIADGMTESEVLAVLTQGSEVENDKDNKAEKVTSNVVGKNGLVGTGSTFTLQAKNSVGDTDEVTVTIIILGDVDGNGKLTGNDGVRMRKFALYKLDMTPEQIVAGNANGLESAGFSREGINGGDAVVVRYKALNKYGNVIGDYKTPLSN